MANRGQANIQVTVDDVASAVLRKINSGLKDVNGSASKLAKSAKNVSDGGAFDTLRKSTTTLGEAFGTVTGAAGKVVGAIAAIAPPLAAITGAASIAAITRLTLAWGDLASRLGNQAARIGMPVAQLQGLENGAQRTGAAVGAMTMGLTTLQDGLQDAVGGRNPELVVLMQKLGVSFRNADGSARKAGDVLPILADKIKGIQNPALQARIATMLFGGAAEDLLPLLRQGSDGIRENTQASKEHGLQTELQVASAKRLQTAQADLTQSVESLRNSVAEQLSPSLVDLFGWFSKIIDSNREWISLKIGDYAREFVTWIKGVDWASVWNGIKNTGSEIKGLIDHMGGLKTVTEVFFGLWAASKVAGVVSSILNIGGALKSILGIPGVAQLLGIAGAVALGYEGAKSSATEQAKREANGEVATRFDEFGNATDYRPQTDAEKTALAGPSRYVPLTERIGDLVHGRGWYHHENAEKASNTTFDTTLDPKARGLLDTIAVGESGGDYSITYGGGHLKDYSNAPAPYHQIRSGPHAGQMSSAFGRYQFLNSTWDEVAAKLGLTDKSPASQDKAAWYLAQKAYLTNTGRNLSTDLRSDDPLVKARIGQALSPVWTSLNGGQESTVGASGFVKRLEQKTYEEEHPPSLLRNPPSGPALDMSGPNARTLAPMAPPVVSGNVTVSLNGTLPNNISHDVTSTGNVTVNNGLTQAPAYTFGGF